MILVETILYCLSEISTLNLESFLIIPYIQVSANLLSNFQKKILNSLDLFACSKPLIIHRFSYVYNCLATKFIKIIIF